MPFKLIVDLSKILKKCTFQLVKEGFFICPIIHSHKNNQKNVRFNREQQLTKIDSM